VKRALAVLLLLSAACASAPPKPAPQPVAIPIEQKPIGSGRVSATALNLRAAASSNAEVVSQLRRGTELTFLAEQKGWLQVRVADGRTGWVSAQHVSRAGAAGAKRRKGGCQPDSDFAFVKSPMPSFSERGKHGLVIVEADVNIRGEVTGTRVLSNSTDDDAMAELAEREIRSARFVAPVRDCVPRNFIFTYKRTF